MIHPKAFSDGGWRDHIASSNESNARGTVAGWVDWRSNLGLVGVGGHFPSGAPFDFLAHVGSRPRVALCNGVALPVISADRD